MLAGFTLRESNFGSELQEIGMYSGNETYKKLQTPNVRDQRPAHVGMEGKCERAAASTILMSAACSPLVYTSPSPSAANKLHRAEILF